MYRDQVFVCDRPLTISLDDDQLLHSLAAKAISFSDGTGYYFNHGVALPPYIVESEGVDLFNAIENEKNAEWRRLLLERYGFLQYAADSGAELVHSDRFGSLYKKELHDDELEPVAFVRVKDASSDREYFLQVPPGVESAREAVAWTFGFAVDEYDPSIET